MSSWIYPWLFRHLTFRHWIIGDGIFLLFFRSLSPLFCRPLRVFFRKLITVSVLSFAFGHRFFKQLLRDRTLSPLFGVCFEPDLFWLLKRIDRKWFICIRCRMLSYWCRSYLRLINILRVRIQRECVWVFYKHVWCHNALSILIVPLLPAESVEPALKPINSLCLLILSLVLLLDSLLQFTLLDFEDFDDTLKSVSIMAQLTRYVLLNHGLLFNISFFLS